MGKQILLTISILVSNRPDTVRKCLDSIKPLLEEVPSELILVDTGCGEQVRGIIEEYTDNIIDFEWCRDFAKARNAGLKKAKGKWFLFLDDDEWFEDTGEIIEFFRSGEYRNYGFAVYTQRNYLDLEGSVFSDLLVGRMTKLEPDVKFIYSIHECFNRVKGKTKKFQAYVHHYGYAYRTPKDARAHSLRNISLLLEEHKADPGNMKHTLQLAQEYNAIDEYSKSLEMSVEGIGLFRQGKIDNEYFLASLFANEINCYMELYRYDEAIEKGEQYLREEKADKMVKAMIAGDLAVAYMERGELEKALKNAEYYWKIYQDYLVDDESFLGFETTITNKCFEQRNRSIVLGNGMRAAIESGKAEVADRWFRSFDWKEPQLFVNNEMLKSLIERMPQAEGEEREIYRKMCDVLLEREELEGFLVQTISDCCKKPEDFTERIRTLSVYGDLKSKHWFFRLAEIVTAAFLPEAGNGKEPAEEVPAAPRLSGEVADLAACVWERPEQGIYAVKTYSMLEAVERLGGDNREILEAVPFYRWKKGMEKYFEKFSWEEADWWNERFTAILEEGSARLRVWKGLYSLAGAVREGGRWEKEGLGRAMESGQVSPGAGGLPGAGKGLPGDGDGTEESKAGEKAIRFIMEKLGEYAACQKALCESIYQGEVIARNPDMLPEEYQGAYLISDFLRLAEAGEYGGAVTAIRQVRKLLSGLDKVVKPCLQWIDGELKRQEQESRQAAGEFQVLARQIKARLRAFMDAGQHEAALAVARQMEPLLPGDEEIRRIIEKLG